MDYVCPHHGDEGILDVVYDYGRIAERISPSQLANAHGFATQHHRTLSRSMWRYADLLPIARRDLIPPLQVGWTPLYHARRLEEKLGLRQLFIKDDGRNPTASFKDRASAVAVVKAREQGAKVVTTASSGNAAAALSGMAASVGLPNVIFVPETAPQAKVAQLLIFGSTVLLVKGTYDQAFDLCLEASKEFGWYCRNTAYNPYMSEGKKTAAYEICEQLSLDRPSDRWPAPGRVFVAVGDGCIIGGLHKGFKDLMALGWIDTMPRLVGVQAEGSAPLVKAWAAGSEEIEPLIPHTIADSISVGIPRDRVKALRAVRQTDGAFISVSDEEILEAMRLLAREVAVFAEPAGATGFAGLQKMVRRGEIDPQERIVVLVTGNGLKDVASAIKATGEPYRVEPTIEDVHRVMER